MKPTRLTLGLMAVCLLMAYAPALTLCGQQPGEWPILSLAERLQKVDHLGIEFGRHQQGEGFTLYVYSAKQQQENLKEYDDYLARSAEFREKQNAFRAKYEEAIEKGASRSELAVIREEASESDMTHPSSIFQRRLLYRVITVGSDFIEVERCRNAEGIELLPLRRLERVVFVKEESSEE